MIFRKHKLALSIFAITMAAFGGMLFVSQRSASVGAANCDPNDVIACGITGIDDLRAKYDANKDNVQSAYSRLGINSAIVHNYSYKVGTVSKNGDVKVDNTVVATNAQSIGRTYYPGSTKVTPDNHIFYMRSTQESFASDSLKAIIFMDSTGKFVGAAIYDCGNPVTATPKPVALYQCTSLAIRTTGRTDATFQASTKIENATLKTITYTVKKGGSVVKTIPATNANPVKYTQTAAGDYTVEATVTVTTPSGQTFTSPVGGCSGALKIAAQPATFACTALKVTGPTNRTSFSFVPTLSLTNGAKLKSIVYTVKDSSGANVYTSAAQSSANAFPYTQEKAGTYTVSAATTFTVDGKDTTTNDANCTGTFTVGAPATVQYKCSSLAVSQNSTKTSITVTPTLSMQNGATLKSIVYTVKDSAGTVVYTSPAQTAASSYTFTQTKPGTYTVSATTTFTANNQDYTTTDSGCSASFTVPTTTVTPQQKCDSLNVTQSGDRTQFSFTPTVSSGAAVKSIVYTVKDASGKVVSTINRNDASTVTYTQSTVGKYTVSAVVTVTVDGKDVTAEGNCSGNFEVTDAPAAPTYKCSQLTGSAVAGQLGTYSFNLSYAADGGAKLSSVAVDYGDGAKESVNLSGLNGFKHTYAKNGTYDVKTTLTFVVNGDSVNPKTVDCATKANVTDYCTITGKENVASNDSTCATPGKGNVPTQLVNTGVADVLGIFAAIVAAGALSYRLVWTRFSHRS